MNFCSENKISVGDFIEIVYRGNIFRCEITNINNLTLTLFDVNNKISTTLSSSLSNGEVVWRLPNNEIPDKVNFCNLKENLFSDPAHTYEKIFFLEQLPYEEFSNMCKTNKLYASLCNGIHSERIYETRSRKEFEEKILELRNSLSWKEFYERVIQFNQSDINTGDYIDKQFRNNNILELKLLLLKGHILYGLAQWAAIRDNIEMLKWMTQMGVKFDNPGIIEMLARNAIKNGSLNVLKWLNPNSILNTRYLNTAITEGQKHIINWFHENGIYEN